MPTSQSHDRERRHKRTSRLPQLDIPESEPQEPQSPSPRTELLSPSTTDRHRDRDRDRDQGTSTHHSSSKKRHGKGSSSRHHSSRRDRDTTRSDVGSEASRRQLLQMVMEQESEAEKLRRTLTTTIQRLEEESQKAAELERDTRETADRFRQLNESRLAAQQEASTAQQELRIYHYQLENAKKEISQAQELVKQLAKEKEEAEQAAARARSKARKLHQRQLVMQAREEGRRLGFEAGIRQAQEESVALAATRQGQGRSSRHSSSRSHPLPRVPPPVLREPSPEPHQVRHRREAAIDEEEDDARDEDTLVTEEVLMSPMPPKRNQGQMAYRAPPSLFHDPPPGPPPGGAEPQQPFSHPPAAPRSEISRARTPAMEVFSIPIPEPDQIVAGGQPRDTWVTASKHQELRGDAPSPQVAPPRPVSQHPSPAPPPPAEAPVTAPGTPYFIIAPHDFQGMPPGVQVMQGMRQGPPPPAPVFPPGQFSETPPKSAGASSKKVLRFPSLAKTKAQAASWYRSLSLRKKNKPIIIDPADDDEVETPGPDSAGTQGPPTGDTQGTEAEMIYQYQPRPSSSWYNKPRPVDAKSTKSRHSRSASAPDGADRLSRASTSISNLDMVASAPGGGAARYEGSISGRSAHNNRLLAQKLSVITEDPHSRNNTPYVDRNSGMGGSMMGGGGRIPAPQFLTVSGQSEAGSARGRHRPPELHVKDPNGIHHPSVREAPSNPMLVPPVGSGGSGPALSRSGSIQIDVQPATAAVPHSARVDPPLTSGNHLTLDYKYEYPRSVRSARENPNYAMSSKSRKSQQSMQSRGHPMAPSFSEPPAPLHTDVRSMRSGHSRSISAAPAIPHQTAPSIRSHRDPPRPSSRMGAPSYAPAPAPVHHQPTSRPASVRPLGPNQPAPNNATSQYLEDPTRGVHRVSSRSSLHSKFNMDTYLDPAFQHGVPNPNASPNRPSRQRSRSASPGLEYV